MRKVPRILIVTFLVIIMVFSGIYFYDSTIHYRYQTIISVDKNCVEPGIGTNFSLKMVSGGNIHYESPSKELPESYIDLLYIGNRTVGISYDKNSFYYNANITSMSHLCSFNYTSCNGIYRLEVKVPLGNISGSGTKSFNIKWNGTIIKYPGIDGSKTIYEPALPGSYAIEPNIQYTYSTPIQSCEISIPNDIIRVMGPEIEYKKIGKNLTVWNNFIGNGVNSEVKLQIMAHFAIGSAHNINNDTIQNEFYNYTLSNDQHINIPLCNKTRTNEFQYAKFTEIWNGETFQWLEEEYAI